MARNDRKKTDIPVPEPRHRVGPKGVVSSGISFRDLPEPSLEEIRKICEHYQQKCAGTYDSLSSRYVYQMATEIELLVDALKQGGYDVSEGSLSTMGGRGSKASSHKVSNHRTSKKTSTKSRTRRNTDNKRSTSSVSDDQHLHVSRPRTASGVRLSQHESFGRSTREFPLDYVDEISADSSPRRHKHHVRISSSRRGQRRNLDSLSHLNLEDQNEEVLRWLKEEMKRSQSLIKHSKHVHNTELVNAKKEVEKVKKAAKLLIKAVHKKGKDKAAKSEATAESERRRRMKSQKMVKELIQSHSSQIDVLKKGLRHNGSSAAHNVVDDCFGSDHGRFFPWGELEDDKTDVSFSLSDASDLTSILDDLADEAYQHSCC